jgi:hypothetical protein
VESSVKILRPKFCLHIIISRSVKKKGNVRMNVTLGSVRVTTVAVKAVSITYSECVYVASLSCMQRAQRFIVICGLSGSTILFYIIS